MKTKRAVARPAAAVRAGAGQSRASPTASPAVSLELRVAELERDLAAARERVAALEAERAHVLNRIDWAIDSLHTVLESEA